MVWLKRLNFFENKQLNKYVDVYFHSNSDFNRSLIKINFKTNSKRLKDLTIRNIDNSYFHYVLLINGKYYYVKHIRNDKKENMSLTTNIFDLKLIEIKDFNINEFFNLKFRDFIKKMEAV